MLTGRAAEQQVDAFRSQAEVVAAMKTLVMTMTLRIGRMYSKTEGLILATNKSCWKGYEKRGTKQKGGKTVNNCVKKGTKKKK